VRPLTRGNANVFTPYIVPDAFPLKATLRLSFTVAFLDPWLHRCCPECAVLPLLRCTYLHVYLVSPPRGQQCCHRHPLGTCELASFQVVHPSELACLTGSCIRMSHARSIGESLSPSLGSDGRTSGWALRLCRLLPRMPCALGGRVPPATSVGSYGCRRRVLSLSRDCGDSTRNGDGIELDVLTEATMQVLSGRTIHFFGR